jgi:hypothetical protein
VKGGLTELLDGQALGFRHFSFFLQNELVQSKLREEFLQPRVPFAKRVAAPSAKALAFS